MLKYKYPSHIFKSFSIPGILEYKNGGKFITVRAWGPGTAVQRAVGPHPCGAQGQAGGPWTSWAGGVPGGL